MGLAPGVLLVLGFSWAGAPGPSWGPPGVLLGSSWAPPGVPPGVLLGSSWGPSWAPPGLLLAPGVLLVPPGLLLGGLGPGTATKQKKRTATDEKLPHKGSHWVNYLLRSVRIRFLGKGAREKTDRISHFWLFWALFGFLGPQAPLEKSCRGEILSELTVGSPSCASHEDLAQYKYPGYETGQGWTLRALIRS